MIYIANSKISGAGRGVFADRNINSGEVVECCEVIEISETDIEILNQTVMVNYIYYLGVEKNRAVIVLGNGSIYNHSYNPNAEFRENKSALEFVALRNIEKDEEILVNYNQGNNNQYPMWFEV